MKHKLYVIGLGICLLLMEIFLPTNSRAAPSSQSTPLRPTAVPAALPDIKMPKFITIKGMTSPGTTYDFIAKWFIAGIKKDYPEVQIRHVPGASEEAVNRIESGEAQFGVGVPGNTWWAITGKGQWENKPQTKIRVLTNLPVRHAPGFVTLASSQIHGIKDLGNKRVHVGLPGFTYVKTGLPHMFDLYGITYDSIIKNGGRIHYGNTGDAVEMLAAGQLDAIWQVGTHPFAPLTSLAMTKGIRLIGYTKEEAERFCDPVKGTPGYVPIELPAGFYKGQDKPVLLAGTWCDIIVDKAIPDEVVYNILVSLWRDKRYLVLEEWAPGWKGADWEGLACAMAGGPWHPGAARFFKDWEKTPALPLNEGGKPYRGW